MQDFSTLNLPKDLCSALEKMNFSTPTPIQAQSIPFALEGKDILGSAQTGTGKTGAFGIPLVAHLLSNPKATALVMTPTRELAVQVMAAIKQMLSHSPQIKTAVLIGGEPMPKQFTQLRAQPRLVVGTPGRINDHLNRGSLNLAAANFLVLDETDRMLDMGFGVQIDAVLKYMTAKRQTLLFSATLPPNIVRLSKQYMTNPERVSAGEVSTPVLKIMQETVRVQNPDKYVKLTEELAKRSGSVIVFVKTKHGADKLAFRLGKDEHEAEAIHGDLRQNKRDKVIRDFRSGRHRILVATDVAARGLDIPHIEHVINYDLPQVAEDYIHRIGRTGRNGAEGSALNFVSSDDGAKWKAIERLLNPDAPREREERGPSSNSNGKRKPSGGYAKKRPFGARNDNRSDSRGQRSDGYRGDNGNRGEQTRNASEPRMFGARKEQTAQRPLEGNGNRRSEPQDNRASRNGGGDAVRGERQRFAGNRTNAGRGGGYSDNRGGRSNRQGQRSRNGNRAA